jgi:hypothetical protein
MVYAAIKVGQAFASGQESLGKWESQQEAVQVACHMLRSIPYQYAQRDGLQKTSVPQCFWWRAVVVDVNPFPSLGSAHSFGGKDMAQYGESIVAR